MTDIEKMAREAGMIDVFQDGEFWQSQDSKSVQLGDLWRFAKAIARECAEIADDTCQGDNAGPAIRAEFEIKEEP